MFCLPPQKSNIGCPLSDASSEIKVLGSADALPTAGEDETEADVLDDTYVLDAVLSGVDTTTSPGWPQFILGFISFSLTTSSRGVDKSPKTSPVSSHTMKPFRLCFWTNSVFAQIAFSLSNETSPPFSKNAY